jgi:hypothetical protein
MGKPPTNPPKRTQKEENSQRPEPIRVVASDHNGNPYSFNLALENHSHAKEEEGPAHYGEQRASADQFEPEPQLWTDSALAISAAQDAVLSKPQQQCYDEYNTGDSGHFEGLMLPGVALLPENSHRHRADRISRVECDGAVSSRH